MIGMVSVAHVQLKLRLAATPHLTFRVQRRGTLIDISK